MKQIWYHVPARRDRLSRYVFSSIVVLVLTLAAPLIAASQSNGWTAHTSMREVTALALSSDEIWVGTTGGLFSFAPTSGEIRRFTIAEGLHGIAVASVAYDPGGDNRDAGVWIGYRDGVVNHINLSDHAIRTFRDIERASRFPSREINRLQIRGDSLLVSTSFGLVVFDLNLREVRDSYTQLGSMSAGAAVRDLVVAPGPDGTDHFWLATEGGVARAPLAALNLKDPSSWTVEEMGLPSTSTNAITFFDGTLYVGTDQGLAVRTADGHYVNSGLSGGAIRDIVQTPERMVAVDNSALIVVEAGGNALRFVNEVISQPVALVTDRDGRVWIGDRGEGLARIAPLSPGGEPQVEDVFFPQGPYHNLFASLDSDPSGNVWAGGVLDIGSGNGFYRLSADGTWTNFIGREFAELQGRDSYTVIHTTEDGGFWAGSQGNAAAQIAPDGSVHVVDHTNSSLMPAAGTTILTGGIGSDSRGRVWITSRGAARPLNVRLSEDEWANLPFQDCDGLTSSRGTYDLIFVDSYDQKWIDVKDTANLRRGIGLMVLDTRNTPEDPSDDVCRFFGEAGSQGQGLPGLLVTAMAEDKTGLMWIGTDHGLAYYINNGVVAHDRTATAIWPQHEDRSLGVFVFQGLAVNDVAVDPANQIWVATQEGAWLIRQSGGGFVLEEHFTTSNSPLLSNIVLAITVEERSGRVFFATDRGLVSYEGDAIAASPDSRELFVYPNPARVSGSEDASILIEGLVEETEIMILAPHGELVRRFSARGGRARWDGRDEAGRPAPSGMYMIVALGEGGEEAAYGKLALIR